MIEHEERVVDVPRIDLPCDAVLQDLETLEDDVVSCRARVQFSPLTRLCFLHDTVERHLRSVQSDATLRNDILQDPQLLLDEVSLDLGPAGLILGDCPVQFREDFFFFEIVKFEQDVTLIYLKGHLLRRGLYLRRFWRFNRDRHERFRCLMAGRQHMSRFSDPSQLTAVLERCRAAAATISGNTGSAPARVASRRYGPDDVLALVRTTSALLRSEGHRLEVRRLAQQSPGEGSAQGPGNDAPKSSAETQQDNDAATQGLSDQSLPYMQNLNPNPEFRNRADADNQSVGQARNADPPRSQSGGNGKLAKDTPALWARSSSTQSERQSQRDFAPAASSTIRDLVNPSLPDSRNPNAKDRRAEPSLESVEKLTHLAGAATDGANLFMNLAHEAKILSKGAPRAVGFIGTALSASEAYDASDGPVGFGWEMTKSVAAGYAGDAAGAGTASGLIVLGVNPLGAIIAAVAAAVVTNESASRGFGAAEEMVKSAVGLAPYVPQYLEQEIEKLYRQQSF
jgi:hypothetical protein